MNRLAEITEIPVSQALSEVHTQKLRLIESGRDIIDLSMINPDIAPPRPILDRLVEATLKPYNHRYAVSRGIRKLREAFSLKYRTKFGVALDPESEVCATMGTKDAIVQLVTGVLPKNRRVLLGSPTYPVFSAVLKVAGIPFDTFTIQSDEDGMVAEIQALFRTHSYGAVLLNFPNNPTGIGVSQGFYEDLSRVVREHDSLVINDFVYGEMDRGQKSVSMLSVPALRASGVETYSMSKAYSVPGWRVGGVCGASSVISKVVALKSKMDYGLFLPIQSAAAFGLSSTVDYVRPVADEYRRRCATLVRGLQAAGWACTIPEFGASVWAELPVELRSEGSGAAVLKLLLDNGVCAMPGGIFGERWNAYVRFAAVESEERIVEVVRRLSGSPLTGKSILEEARL